MADEWTRQKYGDDGDTNPELARVWELRGVKKIVNEANNEDTKWSVFVPSVAYEPENADVKYPVVFDLHGGGASIMLAETYGYAELGGIENFITVCPSDFDMIGDIMDILRAEYPIDESRVYCMGFSMGGMGTLNAGLTYPDLFAALVPSGCSLSGFRSEIGTDEQWAALAENGMPILNFCGSADYIRQYPLNETTAVGYQKWLDINGVDFQAVDPDYNYKLTTDYLEYNVGASFMKSYRLPYQSDFFFGQYQNAEGITVVEVVLMDKAGHVTNGSLAEIGWEFMSHWSRDPQTGVLTYTE